MAAKRKRIRIVEKGAVSTFQTQEIPLSPPAALDKERQIVPDYAPARYNSHAVAPEVAIPRHCILKGATKLRPCHIELLFVGDVQAKEFGVAPGPYLMACSTWAKPGSLIPVRDHEHATRLSAKFCECRSAKRTAASCAASVASLALSGRRGRR